MKAKAMKISMMLMTVLMVFTALGCSSNDEVAESLPPTTGASTATPQATKEPVTLKIYSTMAFPGTFTSGEQMDEVSKEIQRVTGVTLDWVDMSPTPDKTKVIMASGDIPDIFINGNTQTLNDLVESNYMTELGPLLESNGQEIKKTAAKAIDFSQKNLSNNTGKLYFIPGRVSNKDAFLSPVIGVFMRWDYYKELNYPELKTTDDIVNVTAEMLAKHPTTADGKKVFGFSPWLDWGMFHNAVLHQIAFGTTAMPGAQSVAEYDADLNYIDVINDDNSSLWQGALLYSKANRKGLLDPDAFTQKYEDATAKMDAGRVITQVAQWQTDKINAAFQQAGQTDVGYVNIPLTGARYAAGTYNPIGLASYWGISKNSKHPDRAMDVINYIFSEEGSRTIFSGVKGKYWSDESGTAQLTELGLKAKDDPNFMATTGIRKFQNLAGIEFTVKDKNGIFIDLYNQPEVIAKTLTPVKKEWLAHYGVQSEDQLWKKFNGFATNSAITALAPQSSDEVKRVEAKIDSYLKTNLPKLWFAKTDEEFNKVKEQMRADIKKMPDYDKEVAFGKDSIAKIKELIKPYN